MTTTAPVLRQVRREDGRPQRRSFEVATVGEPLLTFPITPVYVQSLGETCTVEEAVESTMEEFDMVSSTRPWAAQPSIPVRDTKKVSFPVFHLAEPSASAAVTVKREVTPATRGVLGSRALERPAVEAGVMAPGRTVTGKGESRAWRV